MVGSKQLEAVATFVEAFGRVKAAGLVKVNPTAAEQVAAMFLECANLIRATGNLPPKLPNLGGSAEAVKQEIVKLAREQKGRG